MEAFRPLLAGARFGDRLIACLGAALSVALTAIVCAHTLPPMSAAPMIVAPMGASAVLAFAVPASPLAQPWPVIGGTTVSALVGVAAFKLIPDPLVSGGVAVGGAIMAMSLLRCLHPPGGAAALTAVIGSPAIHSAGYAFAFMPVAFNAVVLTALAFAFHRFSGHSYPHRATLPADMQKAEVEAAGFHLADIDRALDDMHESFDISREDLDLLLSRAEAHAAERRMVTNGR